MIQIEEHKKKITRRIATQSLSPNTETMFVNKLVTIHRIQSIAETRTVVDK